MSIIIAGHIGLVRVWEIMAALFAILGVVCILYGVLVMSLASGTWFFAFWYGLGAVFLALGALMFTGLWDALPGVVRTIAKGVAVVVVACFLVTQAFIVQGFNDRGEDDLDYLIVLGAQMRDDGPSRVLAFRLDAAYDYLEKNPGTVCIVSGCQSFNELVSEADGMAAYLEAKGIDPTRIIREDQARNTNENIANSMAFFDPETARVGIVTNNFHVYRGVRMAQRQGIVHACGIAAYSEPLFLPNNLARESLSLAKAFVLGQL